jgi:hypothetical protein
MRARHRWWCPRCHRLGSAGEAPFRTRPMPHWPQCEGTAGRSPSWAVWSSAARCSPLIGSRLLSLLGVPQDALRWSGLVIIGLVGVGLIAPAVGNVLEIPFARLSGGRLRREGGGFVLGLSLGLVFVPCAGPALAAITVVSATYRFGFCALLLTALAIGLNLTDGPQRAVPDYTMPSRPTSKAMPRRSRVSAR